MTEALTYVEIEIPTFVPESPVATAVMRFAIDTGYLPNTIDAIPSIKDVKIDPAIISLGEDLGQRATVTVTFRDHRHIFNGEDFYSGTFWGKFRARYGLKLRGYALRVIVGGLGQSLDDMETRHFLIESTDGPSAKGEFQIIAKDVLKLADGDRAQAPVLSNGFLTADITSVATTATLSPAGIGNDEYPASGLVAIGGSEICSFTRAADVLTLTRAQRHTAAAAHTAQDRVQLVLEYVAENPAVIIEDLLSNYAAVDNDFIDGGNWQTEIATYLNTVYTATIAEPTSVAQLVSELIEQVGLILWWDDIEEQLRLQVLRPIASTADTFDGEIYLSGSLEVHEQPEKRLTQVYTYFAKINPCVKEDQINNYRSTSFIIDEAAEADYGTPVIKKIFSRWIPDGGRAVADTLGGVLLARFRDPPRRIAFDLLRGSSNMPILGVGYQIAAWPFQDVNGAADTIGAQITGLNPRADVFELELEEISENLFAIGSPGQHDIIIDANILNVNLRTMHDSIYGTPVSGNVIVCTINTGVIVGSSSTATRAFDVGTWPGGVIIIVKVFGRIEGRGGNGGVGADNVFGPQASATGLPGGTALYTQQAITLDASGGQIWGGGGGGGGGGSVGNVGNTPLTGGNGGGGGAGKNSGNGGGPGGGLNAGTSGNAGTTEAGGVGGVPGFNDGVGGHGGGPGLAGSTGGSPTPPTHTVGGPGGAAGRSIDGISFVTFVGSSPSGDIRGPQVN